MRTLTLLTLLFAAAPALRPAAAQIILQPPQGVPVAGAPRDVKPADVDGDGDLDLVVSTAQPERLEVLENLGSANFSPMVSLVLPAGSSPQGVAAGDLDGDGDVDLAVALEANGVVALALATPAGFQQGFAISAPGGPGELELADLDLDGDWDLLAVYASTGEVALLENLSEFVFAFDGVAHAVGAGPGELAVGELTGDGLLDVAVAVAGTSAIQILAGTGGVGLATGPTLTLGAATPHGLALGDVDGDLDVDITHTYELNGFWNARTFLNLGGGAFVGTASVQLTAGASTSLVLVDLDVDGDLDLATTNTPSDAVSTSENLGGGLFGPIPGLWSTSSNPRRLAAADLDGNGGADLIVAAGSELSLLRNVYGAPACVVATYCTPKLNSLGKEARTDAVGVPAFGPQGFSIVMSDGVPGGVGIAFWGASGPANTPFLGGTFCVQPPTTRLAPRVIDPMGHLAYAVEVTTELIGATRWYQFWYRDPAHPDGTGAALSDGLVVTFCD